MSLITCSGNISTALFIESVTMFGCGCLGEVAPDCLAVQQLPHGPLELRQNSSLNLATDLMNSAVDVRFRGVSCKIFRVYMRARLCVVGDTLARCSFEGNSLKPAAAAAAAKLLSCPIQSDHRVRARVRACMSSG